MTNLTDIFSAWAEAGSMSLNGDKEVTIVTYPTVNPADWEPANVVEIDEEGPWIAGGACLRWYQDLPVGGSDLDVFCRSPKQAGDAIDRIKSWNRYHKKAETANATTFEYWNKDNDSRWTIQVITKKFYNNMQEVVDNFDISVCQIATDGESWLLGKHTAKDIREKNLRMVEPLHPDALKRLTKYWIYGYRPVDGLIPAIQNNPIGRWEFNPSEDYS